MTILAFINKYRVFLALCLSYFVFRFAFLLRLPIFNDEAIYLDWGWRELHGAGLFYSLYDAKQPFLMWIFGIFEILFPDPLFAGRLVSVLAGFLTMVGIYKLGETVWNRQIAYLASVLYIVMPLFSFFDRQALMESAETAVGVWACFAIISIMKQLTQRNAIVIGIILGFGMLIKSTAILFAASTLFILSFLLLRYKNKQTAGKFLGIIAVSLLAVDLILLLQPAFWSTFSTNDRFTLSISELLHFPVLVWITNLYADAVISFFTITPLVLLAGISGIIIAIKQKKRKEVLLVAWFWINLLLQMLVIRNPSQRYLVSFLPLLLLFAASFVVLGIKQKIWQFAAIAMLLIIPCTMTIVQTIAPALYILSLSKIEPYAQPEYVTGNTAGYGLDKIRAFLQTKAQTQPIFVGIAENSGNPESALLTYYAKNPSILVTYFDKQLLGNSLDAYDCITLQRPFFFVSRDEQQGNLNRFFVKLKTMKNPYSNYSLGIYTLKQDCKQNTGHLQLNISL